MKKYFNEIMLSAVVVSLLACNPSSGPQNNTTGVNIIPLTDSNATARTVYLTLDPSGKPVIAWTEEEDHTETPNFYYATWDPGQNIFDQKIKAPTPTGISLRDESMPKIAFNGKGQVYALYALNIPGMENHYASAIKYISSPGAGKTWSAPGFVERDTSRNSSHSYFDVCRLNDGTIAVCWLGNSNGKGRPLLFTKTDSLGRFLPKGKYERIVDSFACQCCRTAIFANDTGEVDIAFRALRPGNIRDIYLSTSPDNGKTFGPSRNFSKDNWKVNGCPENGPDIVSDKENIYLSWYSGAAAHGAYYGTINRETGTMNKLLLSANGQKAQLCRLNNGDRLVVYNERVKDSSRIWSVIMGKTFPGGKPISISGSRVKAFSPVAIQYKEGAIVAWIQSAGGRSQVVYKYVPLKK
jgi:hypothetical protein